MKNIILSFIALFTVSTVSAQVYVGNSKIYSKGTNIYVKGRINLDNSDSNIYLRDGAQLKQGDDNTPNIGAGVVSVYQEGTASNFDYNYWSAPVSEPTGTGNQGFLNSQIHFPVLQADFTATGFEASAAAANLTTDFVTASQAATILHVNTRDGITDEQDAAGLSVTQPLRIAGRWLYSYSNANGYAGWTRFLTSTDRVLTGYGFTMKGGTVTGAAPNIIGGGQRYDFRGRPNNGAIPVAVDTDNWSLIGNPYPSALDLKQFLIDANYNANPSTSGNSLQDSQFDNELHFWEQVATSHMQLEYEGGYGTYVPGAVSNADLDSNGKYTGVDDGMYNPATFSNWDVNGNPVAGAVPGASSIPTGASRRYAAVGQGFAIIRSSANTDLGAAFTLGTTGNADFKNSQRVFLKEDGMSSLFKASPGNSASNPVNASPVFVRPKIRMNVKINNTYARQLLLAFGDDSTDNLDWGLEGKIDANKKSTDVYMPQHGGEYVIKTIPFLETKTVDLGILAAANNSTFEFNIGSYENFDTPYIFIHDKYNNTYHDIKNGTFTTTLDAGITDDRFEIVFQDPTTLYNNTVDVVDQFNVVQNNNNQLLTIFNPNGLEVNNISLFDMAGKEVISSSENSSNNSYSFETANFSAGIYIVRVITTDQKEAAIKVSIHN